MFKDALTLVHLELHRARDGAHLGIVVFVDARLERVGADGVLGAQAKMQRDRVAREQRNRNRESPAWPSG